MILSFLVGNTLNRYSEIEEDGSLMPTYRTGLSVFSLIFSLYVLSPLRLKAMTVRDVLIAVKIYTWISAVILVGPMISRIFFCYTVYQHNILKFVQKKGFKSNHFKELLELFCYPLAFSSQWLPYFQNKSSTHDIVIKKIALDYFMGVKWCKRYVLTIY